MPQIIKPNNYEDEYEFDYEQNETIGDISNDERPYYDDVRSENSYIRPTAGKDSVSDSAYQINNKDNKRHIGRPADVGQQQDPHYYRDSELFIPDHRNNFQVNRKPPPSYRLQVSNF